MFWIEFDGRAKGFFFFISLLRSRCVFVGIQIFNENGGGASMFTGVPANYSCTKFSDLRVFIVYIINSIRLTDDGKRAL